MFSSSLFRKVNNQLPGDTASRLSSKILNAVDYIRDWTGGLDARVT